MNGIIGKKVGMTSIHLENGKNVSCTVIEARPNVITQMKTEESDGYNAFQLAYGERKAKNLSQGLMGHLEKAGTGPKEKIIEFRDFDPTNLVSPAAEGEEASAEGEGLAKKLGDLISVSEVFKEGDVVNVIGTSKGKGFQGVVKRHGFKGVNDATHGQHNRQRAPGSIGAASYPAKVFKGMRMGGRTGGNRIKMQNLQVVKILQDKHLVLIKGAVPGHKGAIVIIEK